MTKLRGEEKDVFETVCIQVVAPDWIFSFRIKCVGLELEPIFGPHEVTEN